MSWRFALFVKAVDIFPYLWNGIQACMRIGSRLARNDCNGNKLTFWSVFEPVKLLSITGSQPLLPFKDALPLVIIHSFVENWVRLSIICCASPLDAGRDKMTFNVENWSVGSKRSVSGMAAQVWSLRYPGEARKTSLAWLMARKSLRLYIVLACAPMALRLKFYLATTNSVCGYVMTLNFGNFMQQSVHFMSEHTVSFIDLSKLQFLLEVAVNVTLQRTLTGTWTLECRKWDWLLQT